MKQFKINSKKLFTSLLFLEETFDTWSLHEAIFKTSQTITMDGCICKDYYSDEDVVPEEILWQQSRPLCFQIIKGKRLPVYFKIILAASASMKTVLAEQWNVDLSEINGLYFNIVFHENTLLCTTGIAYASFPPNKTLAEAWDTKILSDLTALGLDFEQN